MVERADYAVRRRRRSVVAGSRAVRLFHRVELALQELEEVDRNGADLALALAVIRERLERHHLEPHRHVLEEWGLGE